MRRTRRLLGTTIPLVCCLILCVTVGPALAVGDGQFQIRIRALSIVPDDSSSAITTIGGEADVDSAYSFDVDFSYFFTKHIAAELTLAYAEHDVEAVGTAVGNIDLGSLDLLPPTLTLQYHFMPGEAFQPYVGAGFSYVLIPDEDPGDATSISYDDGQFGFALQAGVDYYFNENWSFNLDVKKVWVDVDVSVGALGTTVETNVDVDPWLIGFGVGYRF